MSNILKPNWGALSSRRFALEHDAKWREWIDKIPALSFPKSWSIQVIPPFGGAIARFKVIKPNGDNKSVYLDVFERLGAWEKPYWEVYPYEGDVGRCEIHDVEKLMKMLKSNRSKHHG